MEINRKHLVLLSLILCNIPEQPTPEVTIQQGTLKGRVSSDGKIFHYTGIPYSTANESNRFQPPYPPPSWEGTYNAINEHYRCPQRFGRNFMMGQEDCLKLNVYTPSRSTSTLLPVMVFIHGGRYYENSASPSIYGPEFLVRHDVILVTFNYRLGALGFLCLGIKGAPGNIGIRDQLAALHWVQKNIHAFGGDPENVTLFGESAGASSISFLKLTPLSKGLFKRTIVQSGSSLGAWSIDRKPLESAARLTKQLGFDVTTPDKLLQIYKETSIYDLVTTNVPNLNVSIVTSRLLFIPCMENKISGIHSIITENPYNLLMSGKFNNVPSISGFNDKEGIFLVGKETDETLVEKDKSTYLPSNLEFRSDKERLKVFNKVRQLYFGNKKINKDTLLNLADLYSDVSFTMPSIFEAEYISRTSKNAQYNYFFKYSGYRNLVKYLSGFAREKGAAHADELFYLYSSKLYPFKFGVDQVVIDRLTTMWTNFAKFGNPIPETTPLLPQKWEPSEPNQLKFLTIEENLSMGTVPNPERSSFWNDTYTKFRRKY